MIEKKKKKIQNMSYAMRVGLKSSKMALLLKMVEWLPRYSGDRENYALTVLNFMKKNISEQCSCRTNSIMGEAELTRFFQAPAATAAGATCMPLIGNLP